MSRADDWGRLTGTHVKLRARCIPLLPWDDEKLADAIDELIAAGRIEVYCEQGVWTLQVVGFDDHQASARRTRNLRNRRSRWPARTVSSLARPRCETPANHESQLRAHESGLTPPLHARATGDSNSNSTDSDSKGSLSPTAEVRPLAAQLSDESTAGRSSSNGLLPPPQHDPGLGGLLPEDLLRLAGKIRDGDERTPYVFARLARDGVPPAVFHTAYEQLEYRRQQPGKPLVSEIRYFVATVKTMHRERRAVTAGG